ncbi:alpha/beta fold hydrolase [Peristeroidobacter agariperforans]|uniref:alpha/beta fold hydrolase n=1 Tax=Peristeroidobacter agariperforans TaxID=268404 RepID=UPI00101C046E|nr:alpha/beta fold hydrolase [Peristeroidobacter agariperforans]
MHRLLGLTLASLAPFCAHGQQQWDASAPSAEPVPGFTSIDIGGRSLRYNCQGSGAPTVIIEPGGGVSLETVTSWNLSRGWPVIIRDIAKTTRVCAYDRAGLGRSDKATLPRTSLDAAKDLHELLEKADIEPPYVIAGQSYGGMNARMFTHLYPNTVAGVVLVDSSHPDMYPEVAKVLQAPSPDDKNYALLKGWREGPDLSGSREWVDLKKNAELVRATGKFGDRPLIVLSASPTWNDPYAPDDVEPLIKAVGQRLNADLAALSTNSKHIVATTAGHNIQADEPQLVTAAILDVVAQVRAKAK